MEDRIISLWKDNETSQEWKAPLGQLVDRFMASSWYEHPWPMDRRVAAFVASNEDDDGLQSVIEHEDMLAISDEAITIARESRHE